MNSSMPCLRDLSAHFGRATIFWKVFVGIFSWGCGGVGFFPSFYKNLASLLQHLQSDFDNLSMNIPEQDMKNPVRFHLY